MNAEPLEAVADRWRTEAETLRRRGASSVSACLLSCAEDLEEGIRRWQLEALTLEEAAEESGYSYSALQSKVAVGELPNAGEKGRPRIRRCDLPLKGGSSSIAEMPDLAGEVLDRRLSAAR